LLADAAGERHGLAHAEAFLIGAEDDRAALVLAETDGLAGAAVRESLSPETVTTLKCKVVSLAVAVSLPWRASALLTAASISAEVNFAAPPVKSLVIRGMLSTAGFKLPPYRLTRPESAAPPSSRNSRFISILGFSTPSLPPRQPARSAAAPSTAYPK
jgi:hypothetical protein